LTLDADLDEILERSESDLSSLRGAHLFITGGTGFIGTWLLEALALANERMGLNARLTVLTRNPEAFTRRMPRLSASNGTVLMRGDVCTLVAAASYDIVIHAATPGPADLKHDQPRVMIDTVVLGTQRVMEVAARSGAIPVLLASSGAVYGAQPPELPRMPESFGGAPDPLDAGRAYHECKRVAELECALYARSFGIRPKIARLFAFVGPYLPLDRHFAIGNFIGDALRGGPIEVRGDGTTVRSYLYASELAIWLLAILVRGEPLRAYNVGSELAVDISSLARSGAACTEPPLGVRIMQLPKPGNAVDRYVPDTSRARSELRLEQRIGLADGIARTLQFYRSRQSEPIGN
jgi:nucleoside-diphosphate-sugar epimerase